MKLTQYQVDAFIGTAPSETFYFVSRFFAPNVGINEDSVTGSAHCQLVPYWANRLGKSTLQARQISTRGGNVLCSINADRVLISGAAVTFMCADIFC